MLRQSQRDLNILDLTTPKDNNLFLIGINSREADLAHHRKQFEKK